jgi:hypothetical protein
LPPDWPNYYHDTDVGSLWVWTEDVTEVMMIAETVRGVYGGEGENYTMGCNFIMDSDYWFLPGVWLQPIPTPTVSALGDDWVVLEWQALDTTGEVSWEGPAPNPGEPVELDVIANYSVYYEDVSNNPGVWVRLGNSTDHVSGALMQYDTRWDVPALTPGVYNFRIAVNYKFPANPGMAPPATDAATGNLFVVPGDTRVPGIYITEGKSAPVSPWGVPVGITVDAPNGGEAYAGGSLVPIQYTISGGTAPYTVSLLYSTDSGATYPYTVTDALTHNAEGTYTYEWTAPSITSTAVRVKAEVGDAAGETASDASDGDFEIDSTAPAAVTLAAGSPTEDSITLTWTAPGDDGTSDTATSYDIRYSDTGAIDETNWDLATQAVGEPMPSPAGTAESFVVTGLVPNTTYWFALKTIDNVGLASAISNSPAETTISGVTVSIDTPNGGEAFAGGSTVTVQYTITGGSAPYAIWLNYSTDGGLTYPHAIAGPIAHAAAGTYIYDWLAPTITETDVRVKAEVYDAVPTHSYDTSDGDFIIDAEAPTCTATVVPATPDGANGWYVSDITITLSASDAGSGVATIYYGINDAWYEYTKAFVIATDGTYVVGYYTVDNVGNTGDTTWLNFKLDKTPPTAVELYTPANNTFLETNDVSFSWSAASDATSGFSRYELQVAADADFSAPVLTETLTTTEFATTLPAGTYYWRVLSFDIAGNSAGSLVWRFNIGDTLPPSIYLNVTRTANISHTRPTAISAEASDDNVVASLVVGIYDELGECVEYVKAEGTSIIFDWYPSKYLPDGSYTIVASAWDGAGNLGSTECAVDVYNMKEKVTAVRIFTYPAHEEVTDNVLLAGESYVVEVTVTNLESYALESLCVLQLKDPAGVVITPILYESASVPELGTCIYEFVVTIPEDAAAGDVYTLEFFVWNHWVSEAGWEALARAATLQVAIGAGSSQAAVSVLPQLPGAEHAQAVKEQDAQQQKRER